MSKVIKIAGYKRHGKDTVAGLLQSALEGKGYTVQIVKFADELKEIASHSLGLSLDDLELQKNFETNLNGFVNHREYLQKLGDKLKEAFGEDCMLKATQAKVKWLQDTTDIIIIPDWRFKYEKISDADLNIRVHNYQNVVTDTHKSERDLDDVDIPIVPNDGKDMNMLTKNVLYWLYVQGFHNE